MQRMTCTLAMTAWLAAGPAHAAGVAPAAAPQTAGPDHTALAAAAGAVAGVVAFNVLALGWEAVPVVAGYARAGQLTVPAEMSVAMSRIYAVSSAAGGALIAAQTSGPDASASARLLTLGGGALLGVTAFNLLTAPLGTVPLAGAALNAVPVTVAAGSRLLAAGSAAAGAAASVWLYDRQTGRSFPAGYAASLAAGALAGVAAANVLTAGTLGTLPYFAGSGAVAGELAAPAAQAASRIYVIGAGVLGGLAADALYTPVLQWTGQWGSR